MRTITRRLRAASSAVFAPAIGEDHALKIAQFRAWRVKEPVSNRRYTVVRLQSQGGVSGYGEGGPLAAFDLLKPYLQLLLGFLGFSEVSFVGAEGTTAEPAVADAHFAEAHARIIATPATASWTGE